MTKTIIITTGLMGNRKSLSKTINPKSDRGLKICLLKSRGSVYNTDSGIWIKDSIAFSSNDDKWITKRNGEKLCIPANGLIRWDETGRAII